MKRFAGFIMTYERAATLRNTVEVIFRQSLPPAKLLIVDNSASDETELMIKSLNDSRIDYYKVGYNSGPAGAARIGLQKLKAEGYDWIYWGDDDDPPRFDDCFELLLANAKDHMGAIGAVGSIFNWKTGLRERYPDKDLRGLLSVDSIGGGFCFLVNARALDENTLPDTKLYFGLEEFDFCQKLKLRGYGVYVLGELLYRYREQSKKLGVEKKPSLVPRRSYNTLHRDYYSYRNAIYLMAYAYGNKKLVLKYLLRCFGKIPFGFAKGFKFGLKNTRMMTLAAYHGLTQKMGKTF